MREICATDGEPAFRRAGDRRAASTPSPSPEPLVIAAAGGVVLREENRAALRGADADVVWLRADPDVLVDRVGHGEHRPLLDGDPPATLRRMQPDREPLYREVADVVVDTDAVAPDAVAEQIARLVGDGRRVTDLRRVTVAARRARLRRRRRPRRGRRAAGACCRRRPAGRRS